MATFWFLLVALMLVAYVVLDGFDLGVGAIYKWVAKTPEERSLVRRSIGPVWDANEVWLLAAGGTLYFAFPALYAASFSGFYLPLMMVLWLLIGRALGLELRSHLGDELFAEACDTVFMVSSLLLPVFFGAALGNVIRGVPLDADGTFFLPLWTNFRPGDRPGVLDWYTVTCGVVALAALATHGAHYLALRVGGDLNERARRLARLGTYLLPVLTLASLGATVAVRPSILEQLPLASNRVADSAGGRLQPGGHGGRRAAPPRTDSLLRLGHLPGVDAGGCGLRPLPGAPAVDGRSGTLADHRLQRRRGLTPWAWLSAGGRSPSCWSPSRSRTSTGPFAASSSAGDAEGYH